MKFQYNHSSYSFDIEKGVGVESIGFVIKVERYLNDLGKEGWRLVHEMTRKTDPSHNTGHYSGLFMREIPEPPAQGQKCVFCAAVVSNMPEHLLAKHREEMLNPPTIRPDNESPVGQEVTISPPTPPSVGHTLIEEALAHVSAENPLARANREAQELIMRCKHSSLPQREIPGPPAKELGNPFALLDGDELLFDEDDHPPAEQKPSDKPLPMQGDY